MDSVISKFEQVMMPVAKKISGNKYLLAMRDSFSMLLPFIIVGSFFGIIEWVVLDPDGTIMGENGMNLGHAITGLSGDAYQSSGFVATLKLLQGLCNNVVTVGFGIFSFMLVAAFAYRLGGIWGGDKFSTALTAIGAFIIMTPQQVNGAGGFSLDYFGNKAVLTSIIVATISAWIFVKLSQNEKIKIKMSPTVPPAVSKSFAVLIPVFCTLTFFTIFATILSGAIFDLIYIAMFLWALVTYSNDTSRAWGGYTYSSPFTNHEVLVICAGIGGFVGMIICTINTYIQVQKLNKKK